MLVYGLQGFRENLESVLDLFPGVRVRLAFCWSQGKCSLLSDVGKPKFLKPLDKVWEAYKKYNETNTLLIDDSPSKAICNPDNTGIFPYSYECFMLSDKSLGPEGDLRAYLDQLAEEENVRIRSKQPIWSGSNDKRPSRLQRIPGTLKGILSQGNLGAFFVS